MHTLRINKTVHSYYRTEATFDSYYAFSLPLSGGETIKPGMNRPTLPGGPYIIGFLTTLISLGTSRLLLDRVPGEKVCN